MGIMARSDKQFTLIYNTNTRVGSHALAYLQALEDKLLAIDISKTKVSDSQWVELAEAMHKKVGDLIDKRKVEADNTNEFNTTDWLKILQKNPDVLQHPIAINGDKTVQLENGPDVLAFFGVDSAGMEKTFHTEDPVIKPDDK